MGALGALRVGYEMHNFAIRRQRQTFATRTASPPAATHRAVGLMEARRSEVLTLSMVSDRRRRRAKRAPLTASKLRKKEASMKSAALPAKLAPSMTQCVSCVRKAPAIRCRRPDPAVRLLRARPALGRRRARRARDRSRRGQGPAPRPACPRRPGRSSRATPACFPRAPG